MKTKQTNKHNTPYRKAGKANSKQPTNNDNKQQHQHKNKHKQTTTEKQTQNNE